MGSIGPTTNDASSHTKFHCVIKGGGPAGLAAALSVHKALSDHFRSSNPPCSILVVEKRPCRPTDQGRRNMVAIRPEGLRRLNELGALAYLRDRGWITDLEKGTTINEWDQQEEVEGSGIFEWPISRYEASFKVRHPLEAQAEDNKGETESENKKEADENVYQIPGKISEQIPCCFVDLGHLEDALLDVISTKPEMEVQWNASIELLSAKDGTYKVLLHKHLSDTNHTHTNGSDGTQAKALPLLPDPDLVILASGKNDHSLEQQLNYTKTIGLKLEETNLPNPSATTTTTTTTVTTDQNPRGLTPGPPHEIESQLFSVFGLVTPSRPMGRIMHVNRKHDTGTPQQPIVEIDMSHRGATHLLLQIPRGFDTSSPSKLDAYMTRRVNAVLHTTYTNVAEMKRAQVLVWGNPLAPVTVETATAMNFVFGRNVVLVGDAGVSCSPSSGVGADIGLTVDSQSVERLVGELLVAKDSSGALGSDLWRKAMDGFSVRKAATAVIWSGMSRMFYITHAEADEIVRKTREHEMENKVVE